MFVQHRERHRTDRIGWLRAAVLGANDLTTARPVQAAFASAGTFAIGAAMPLLTALSRSIVWGGGLTLLPFRKGSTAKILDSAEA